MRLWQANMFFFFLPLSSVAFNILELLPKHSSHSGSATSLQRTSGSVLMSVMQQMIVARHGDSRTTARPVSRGAHRLQYHLRGLPCSFSFYSNSGHTGFPFAGVVINLSPLIACTPGAFRRGGLKAERCIFD